MFYGWHTTTIPNLASSSTASASSWCVSNDSKGAHTQPRSRRDTTASHGPQVGPHELRANTPSVRVRVCVFVASGPRIPCTTAGGTGVAGTRERIFPINRLIPFVRSPGACCGCISRPSRATAEHFHNVSADAHSTPRLCPKQMY